jgi:hypothetical protein
MAGLLAIPDAGDTGYLAEVDLIAFIGMLVEAIRRT